MPADDCLGIVRLNLCVERRRLVGKKDFDNGRLVTHADAANTFDRDIVETEAFHGVAEQVEKFVAALGHAAGTETDANLRCADLTVFATAEHGIHVGNGFMPGRAEILNHHADGVGREMPVGRVVNHYHRRKRATAQTRDALNGEFAVRAGVIAGGNEQLALDGVLNVLRCLDVAGGAVTDANPVLAGRLETELVIERADTDEVRKADAGHLAGAPQYRLRQIPVLLLNALQDRYGRVHTASCMCKQLLKKLVV